jgi:hypothetical protein
MLSRGSFATVSKRARSSTMDERGAMPATVVAAICEWFGAGALKIALCLIHRKLVTYTHATGMLEVLS